MFSSWRNVFKYSKTFVLDFYFPFCKLIRETEYNLDACICVVLPGHKLVAAEDRRESGAGGY